MKGRRSKSALQDVWPQTLEDYLHLYNITSIFLQKVTDTLFTFAALGYEMLCKNI